MRVAICDANIRALETLRTMMLGNPLVHRIHGFMSLEELWDTVDAGVHFDVVFLKIIWEQPHNGIDYASCLWKRDPNAQIIYMAEESDRLAQHIFLKPANLCGYLVKPVEQDLLNRLLEKAWRVLEEMETEKLMIRQKGAFHAVPLRKICYLESRGHQIIIHTTQGRISCYDRLESVKARLPEHFQQCHKSYLVNLDNVRRMERNRMILDTGDEIPISRAKYPLVKEAYSRYVGNSDLSERSGAE